MNKILRKLRSKAGESMILAMVFMLFCSFVGGSVLASATANAQRVAQIAEEQEFLLERSAALLMADELKLEKNGYFRVKVVDEDQTIQPVLISEDGGIHINGASSKDRRIAFTLQSSVSKEKITPLQQMMAEAAVKRYLLEKAPGISADKVSFAGFPSSTGTFVAMMPTSTDKAEQIIQGSIGVSFEPEGENVPKIDAYTANYVFGTGEDIYSMYVDFGDMSQLKLSVSAYSGTSVLEDVLGAPIGEGTNTVQITTDYTNTSIYWMDPFVEKGGAAR